ncbi:hypothetical protein FOL47_002642, partial [Perkinsus chesapeaki]
MIRDYYENNGLAIDSGEFSFFMRKLIGENFVGLNDAAAASHERNKLRFFKWNKLVERLFKFFLGRMEESCTFDVLIMELVECIEDYLWEGESEDKDVILADATMAAEWALETPVIYTDASSRYYVPPSRQFFGDLQSSEDMRWLDDIAACYLPWRDWHELREIIENIYIIDTGETKEHKKQKQEACVHCLGVRLLASGHLGRFNLEELMPFAPKSRGEPAQPAYTTTTALQRSILPREKKAGYQLRIRYGKDNSKAATGFQGARLYKCSTSIYGRSNCPRYTYIVFSIAFIEDSCASSSSNSVKRLEYPTKNAVIPLLEGYITDDENDVQNFSEDE